MRSFATANGRSDLPWTKAVQIGLYHLGLFLVMISFFALAAVMAVLLAGFTILQFLQIVNLLLDGGDGELLDFVPLMILCGLLFLRMAPLLWVQLRGLVTAQHDEKDPDALYGMSLRKDRYPEFYAHVAAVARRISAPIPDEIRITPEPECHVVEVRKFAILPDRRLVLVLGMAHLCVLSEGELDVILAHELSHLRSGDTRLSVFVFRFLESLETGIEWEQESRWRWTNLLYPLSLFYRAIMRPLTAPLIRRQEILADAVSARAFGGDLAALTLLKEWQLNHHFNSVVAGYEADGDAEGWTGLFRKFRKSWQEFSEEGRAYLLKRLEEEEHYSFWDSHPTTSARIAVMRQFPDAEGDSHRPARRLFPDFRTLESRVSSRFAQTLVLELLAAEQASGEDLVEHRLAAMEAPVQSEDDDTVENMLDETIQQLPSQPPEEIELPQSEGLPDTAK